MNTMTAMAAHSPQTKPRFCTRCGKSLMPRNRFCTGCGKPVTPDQTPPTPSAGSSTPPWQTGAPLHPGMIMGSRWRVVRQLGKGGMGAVYLVEDTRLNNRLAALKEMLDGSQTQEAREEAMARFNQEAETLASLYHVGIPHIYDRFIQMDRIYMVMEYIDGMDLERLLSRCRRTYSQPYPERALVRHAYQVVSVLEYLHGQTPPMLHRDLKPSNLILHPSGMVKLIDFGIAKVFNPGRQGTGLGTQGYAAPEIYKGLAEPASDIYALGATLHHLASGRNPQRQAPFDFPPLRELVPISQQLDALILSMLAIRQEDRPANAGEIRKTLLTLYPDIHDWEEDQTLLALLPGATTTPADATQASATSAPAAKPETGSESGYFLPTALGTMVPDEIVELDDGAPYCILGSLTPEGQSICFLVKGDQLSPGARAEPWQWVHDGEEACLEPIDLTHHKAEVDRAWNALLSRKKETRE